MNDGFIKNTRSISLDGNLNQNVRQYVRHYRSILSGRASWKSENEVQKSKLSLKNENRVKMKKDWRVVLG